MINLKELNNKITVIQNTKKITQVMEMISISKMKKIKNHMTLSLPYFKAINRVIKHLVSINLEYKHPYIYKRNIKCIGYIIISTDKGLSGSLNLNLFKKVISDIKLWNNKSIKCKLSLIGSKAISFFAFDKANVIAQISGIKDIPSIIDIIGPIKVMLQAYDDGILDKIYVANNKFINTVTQVPKITQIIPLLNKDNKISTKDKNYDYLYESDSRTLLNILLQRYVESQIYHRVIENLISEQSARMVAMKTATDNSNNLIKELQLIRNKVRQANITQELNEIISGSSSI